jgi:hypothetical protein
MRKRGSFASVLMGSALVACGPAGRAPLLATSASSEAARASVLSAEGPWMKHELAAARAGDVLLENAFVRFYIAGKYPGPGLVPFVGWIMDAGLAASPERADYDGIEEFFPLVNVSPVAATSVTIVSDGADGERARVDVTGPLQGVPDMFSLQGAQPMPIPATVTISYSLGPYDHALEIRTRVENTTSTPLPTKIGDLVTFSDDEAEPFSIPGGFSLDSTAQAVTLLGSAHETRPASLALFGENGPLSLFAGSTVRDQVGGNDTGMWGYDVADTTLEPGDVLEAARYLAVGTDVASLLELVPALQAETRATGVVTSRGQAVRGARVSFFRDAELTDFVSQALSDADGRFAAELAPGDYFAVATGRGNGELVVAPGVTRELAEGYLPSPVTPLSVPSDGDASLALELGAAARVKLSVRDTRGAPLPAKITFIAEDPRPAPIAIAGERIPYPGQRIRQLAWTASGDAELPLEPGVYTVIASHGPSYEIDVRQGVVLDPGAPGSLDFRLEPVVAHAGYVMLDSHVHGVFSQHGEATAIERVITAAAEGLDVAIAADHDFVGDYAPANARAGLGERLLDLSGVELTTQNGHHCIWPLIPDPASGRGGAGPNSVPLEQAYAYYRARGAQVFTVAHGAGYFASAGYDLATGEVSRPEHFTWGFNAMELHNGKGWGGVGRLIPIFASLINHGHRVAPVAASDSHTRAFEVGVGRTYARIGHAARSSSNLAGAVSALHTVASTGPFIELDAAGAGPGDLVTLDAEHGVTLSLSAWAPSWMPLERVVLYENGVERARWDTSTEPTVKLRPGSALWFEHELRLTPTVDAWYSVEVASDADLSPVVIDVYPWAYTAPLFVDADGDSAFSAPCAHGPCPAP